MFLSSTYFQGDIYLPLSEINPNVVGVARMRQTVAEKSLDYFITKYEYEYLYNLLGSELYSAYLMGITSRTHSSAYSVSYGSYLTKYEAEMGYSDGQLWTQDPYEHMWIRLRDLIYQKRGNYYFSPAANYVYYWICRSAASQTTEMGEIKFRVSDTEIVSSSYKLARAWNDMCRESDRIRNYILLNWEKYKFYGDKARFLSHGFSSINVFNL